MGHIRFSVGTIVALVGVLVAGASCAPDTRVRPQVVQAVPPPTARRLLRDLALDVPEGRLPTYLGPVDDTAAAFVRAAPPFLARAQTEDDATRAADCLTAAVYYEARSEPVEGQQAVAQVVLNRVRDRAFPKSICGVVYQGAERRTGCQFSFTCDGSMARRRDPAAWERARRIADYALAGGVYAPVGSATFFHTNAILPWWASSMARIGAVGAHIFYRWRGGMERALAFRQDYAGVEPGTPLIAATAPVSVHYGIAADAAGGFPGVTIHRGVMAPEGGDVAAVPAHQAAVVGGIRVHRGKEAPVAAFAGQAEATVGEEEDPG